MTDDQWLMTVAAIVQRGVEPPRGGSSAVKLFSSFTSHSASAISHRSFDVIERDRPEGRHGHVEAVGQVAIGVITEAVPELGPLGDLAGQLEDDGVPGRRDGGLENQ